MQLNFSRPLDLSTNNNHDFIAVRIKKREMFVSQLTLKEIQVTETKNKIVIKVPRQLPEGYSEEELTSQAQSTSNSITAMILIQAVA